MRARVTRSTSSSQCQRRYSAVHLREQVEGSRLLNRRRMSVSQTTHGRDGHVVSSLRRSLTLSRRQRTAHVRLQVSQRARR
jgi:hypothetical protein